MENLVTLAVAVAIGLFSLFAGQRNKNKTAPRQQNEDVDYDPSEELEQELSTQTSSSTQNSQHSTLDVLGRILTGDLSDLVGQPKKRPSEVDHEYVDPMVARRRKQTQKEADSKERWDIEDLLSKKKVKPPSPTALALRTPGALRQAIIISELLDKPVSKRRRNR